MLQLTIKAKGVKEFLAIVFLPFSPLLPISSLVSILNFATQVFSKLEMKKIVLKLDLHDNKCKQKAMQKAAGLSGVDSVSFGAKDQKLTVTGDIDPVVVVTELRKLCHTDIVTVGPAKEPEKKKEPKEKKPEKPKATRPEPKKPESKVPKGKVPPKEPPHSLPSHPSTSTKNVQGVPGYYSCGKTVK